MEMAAIMSEQLAFSAKLLIDAIKQHPVLFDKSHPGYKEAEFKKELWMKIAADLGVTVRNFAYECNEMAAHVGKSARCPASSAARAAEGAARSEQMRALAALPR
ncbi:hypothetical protein HPB50_004063 [Hyalomma asiaticum]|uniref:Uncharacterized protein n=1 Tax=Hyalomma asiaticum TaxID=266040 RepID=A0ACB7SXB6_HYAAI|nr:hypothetical protein HPB50_004063 [Hyalomma asiaticum]